MPKIPTFDATVGGRTQGGGFSGVVNQPKAQAATGVAGAVAQAGSTLQQIGATLADKRDKNDIVNAQYDLARKVAELDNSLKDDYNVEDLGQRREDAYKEIVESSLEGISDRARQELAPKFKSAADLDKIAFESEIIKRDGLVRLGKFEENRQTAVDMIAFARNDEELENAVNGANTAVDSVSDFLEVGTTETTRQELLRDGYFARAKLDIKQRALAGEEFPEEMYRSWNLPAQDIITLKGSYNSSKVVEKDKSKALYNARLSDERAITEATGTPGTLARDLEVLGNTELAREVRHLNELDVTVHSVISAAKAERGTVNVNEIYDTALKKLEVGPDTKDAAHVARAKKRVEVIRNNYDAETERIAKEAQRELDRLARDAKTEERVAKLEAKSKFREEFQGHRVIVVQTGEAGDFAEQFDDILPSVAEKIRAADKVDLGLHKASKALGPNFKGTIKDRFDTILKDPENIITADTEYADIVKAGVNRVHALKSASLTLLANDPAAATLQAVVPEKGETTSSVTSRRISMVRELSGNVNHAGAVYTLEEADRIKSIIAEAERTNDGETLKKGLDELRKQGRYAPQAIDELKLNGGYNLAVNAQKQRSDLIVGLIQTDLSKAKPDFKDKERSLALAKVNRHPNIKVLQKKLERNPNARDAQYLKDVRDIGIKAIAMGKTLDDVYGNDESASSYRVDAIVPAGTDIDAIQTYGEEWLQNYDFLSTRSIKEEDRVAKAKYLNRVGSLINASVSDERIEFGKLAFYVYNPETRKAALDQRTGRPIFVYASEFTTKKSEYFKKLSEASDVVVEEQYVLE